MIVRIIILAIIIWLVWYWLIRQPDTAKKTTQRNNEPENNNGSTRMVKCADCQLFLPIDEALQYGDHHFCSQQHLAHFNHQTHSADS